MASIISNFEVDADRSRETKRRKRRKIDAVTAQQQQSNRDQNRWRSSTEQTTYSSKLVEALRHVRRNSAPASTVSYRGRVVRETADKVLAIAARGRFRWSRAILANRLKIRLKNHKKAAKAKKSNQAAPSGSGRLKSLEAPTRMLPPLQRRVRVLGKLVPGCRKLSFPSLLEEATDYISALEMQVRAMSALAELLTGAGRSTGDSDRRDLT